MLYFSSSTQYFLYLSLILYFKYFLIFFYSLHPLSSFSPLISLCLLIVAAPSSTPTFFADIQSMLNFALNQVTGFLLSALSLSTPFLYFILSVTPVLMRRCRCCVSPSACLHPVSDFFFSLLHLPSASLFFISPFHPACVLHQQSFPSTPTCPFSFLFLSSAPSLHFPSPISSYPLILLL